MSNTWKYLKHADKNAIDLMDVETLDEMIKKSKFESYVRVFDILTNIKKEGMRLNEDQTLCLAHPVKLWGSKAELVLREMRTSLWKMKAEKKKAH